MTSCVWVSVRHTQALWLKQRWWVGGEGKAVSPNHEESKIKISPDTGGWQGLTQRCGGSLEVGIRNNLGS